MHSSLKTHTFQAACAFLLLALSALPAAAQFAKWPAENEAGGAQVLRAYGSGVIAPAMREAAMEFGRQRGIIVNVTAGPVAAWKQQAIRDADLVFADSEHLMNSFVLRDLPAILDPLSISTLPLHPSAILVRTGNPKGINRLRDLGTQGLKLLVIGTPEGGGAWEDAVRRAGGDKLVEAIRGNIAFYAVSSFDAKALWASEPDCDAWLDLRPDGTKSPKVITAQESAIYRACVIAFTNRSPQRFLAEEFAAFIESPEGQAIFLKRIGPVR